MLLSATPTEEIQKVVKKITNGAEKESPTEESVAEESKEEGNETETKKEENENGTAQEEEANKNRTAEEEEGNENRTAQEKEEKENLTVEDETDNKEEIKDEPEPDPQEIVEEPEPEPEPEEPNNNEPPEETNEEPERSFSSKSVTKSRPQTAEEDPPVEPEGVIEGVVNGENEVEILNEQGQDSTESNENNDPEVVSMVESGNMEQLAALVLNGEGDKLVGQTSDNPELQSFLDNVQVYMVGFVFSVFL